MTAAAKPRDHRADILTLSGYGIRVAVEGGHLVLEDGIAGDRRRLRLPRVGTGLARVVVLGRAGSVTLDALQWIRDVGAAFVQLDREGTVVATSGAPRAADGRRRRAQALAGYTPAGLRLARELIADKVAGQARLLRALDSASPLGAAFDEALSVVNSCPTIDRLRVIEGRIARAYWGTWERAPVHFVARARHKVPDRWAMVGRRHSPLTGRPQHAVTPANAILNYLYGVAEAEARLACLAIGLDPALGVLHADREGRASLALDLLEPVRPAVDEFVLRLLVRETFDRDDFFELRDGSCRLLAPMTERLAETGPRWAELVTPWAERAARLFDQSAALGAQGPVAGARGADRDDGRLRLPKLLRAWPGDGTPPQPLRPQLVTDRCRGCGGAVPKGLKRRLYCDACLPGLAKIGSDRATAVLRERQAAGLTSGATEMRRRKRLGAARSRRVAEMRAWERAHPTSPNPHVFAESILPKLAGVSPRAVCDATGLSISYSRRVLQGRYVPHPMHWSALGDLATRVQPQERP